MPAEQKLGDEAVAVLKAWVQGGTGDAVAAGGAFPPPLAGRAGRGQAGAGYRTPSNSPPQAGGNPTRMAIGRAYSAAFNTGVGLARN